MRLTLNKECISNTTTIYNTDTCIYRYHNHCWINWTTFNSQHTLTLVKCYKISLKHVTNNTLTLVLADEFIDLLFWWRSTITHVISTKDPSCILSADKSTHSFNSTVGCVAIRQCFCNGCESTWHLINNGGLLETRSVVTVVVWV